MEVRSPRAHIKRTLGDTLQYIDGRSTKRFDFGI